MIKHFSKVCILAVVALTVMAGQVGRGNITIPYSLTTVVNPNTELYTITDGFVESLYDTYDSYGIVGGLDHTKYTSDRAYKVMPTGRLVNVRIERSASSSEYEALRSDLKDHYRDNWRVHDVYICGGGTVMIDCRR